MNTKPKVVVNNDKPVKVSKPYDEKKGLKQVATLRGQMHRAAIRYIREGTEGALMDRVRRVSEASGIAIWQLELEAKKQ